jgi:hypothetical protein
MRLYGLFYSATVKIRRRRRRRRIMIYIVNLRKKPPGHTATLIHKETKSI